MIERVLELQSTLDDLSKKVTDVSQMRYVIYIFLHDFLKNFLLKVKEENLKLKSENSILGGYIENLMSASSVFQSAMQKQTKKQ